MNYSNTKKPIWQLILIYVVVGGAIYGLLYYFVLSKNSSYTPPSGDTSQTTPGPIVLTKVSSEKGDYLTDTKGMSLYIFDKDSANTSTCAGQCLANWPIYTAVSASTTGLPENVSVTKATTGEYMYTWKGMPLYYYVQDKTPTDTLGDGVGGIWHLVKP